MLQCLKTLFACLGALVALVVIVPPTWYARWLSGPWMDDRAPVLIVLSAGSIRVGMMDASTYWRCVYAVDVWHWGGVERMVLSGSDQDTASMRTWIIGQGVPADRVAVENHSGSTRENALLTAVFLRNIPGPYMLLTSDIHMWRAQRAFRKAGITAFTRPAPDAFKQANHWQDRWSVFLDITTECVKILYYKAHGWI